MSPRRRRRTVTCVTHGGETAVQQTYLVEHYRPGVPVDELRQHIGRVRTTLDEYEPKGRPMRFLRCTIVPKDEAFLCLVEAACESLVREAYGRAGVAFDRISVAIIYGGKGDLTR
jgi:hypothetical protein